MRRFALILVLAAACGSSRAEAERKARAAQAEAQRQQVIAVEKARAAAHEAEAAKLAVEARAKAAIADVHLRELATQAKAELDKVYQSDSSYDLDVTTQAASSAHAAKLAAMPHVTVGDLTVGYEQESGLSVTGTSSKRHFRATWRRGDRDVIVGFQTASNLDLAAFAKLLQKLVPAVERVLL
jgi:hypothetical protein